MMIGHTLLSAGTHLVAREATRTMDPLALGVMRLVSAALIFAVLLRLTPGPKLPWPGDRLAFLTGPCAGLLNQGSSSGVKQSNATHASLLYALTPSACTASLALGRERSRPRRLDRRRRRLHRGAPAAGARRQLAARRRPPARRPGHPRRGAGVGRLDPRGAPRLGRLRRPPHRRLVDDRRRPLALPGALFVDFDAPARRRPAPGPGSPTWSS
ncbi:MAG: hypothetical protein U1F43_00290 [Myxococcota bacterium]